MCNPEAQAQCDASQLAPRYSDDPADVEEDSQRFLHCHSRCDRRGDGDRILSSVQEHDGKNLHVLRVWVCGKHDDH